MKIAELQLIKFGPFDGQVLQFPPDAGLHIVFGRNEAGKSSALRAVKAFLYGIPRDTPDTFRFDGDSLRIGGSVIRADGTQATLLRRKGSKSLLNPDGSPAQQNALDRFLSGVDSEAFATLFGIDHKALQTGSELLLKERGNAALSLFSAAIAHVDLRAISADLDSRAKLLFAARGQNPAINAGIREYNQCCDEVKKVALASKEYTECVRQLDEQERQKKLESESLRKLSARQRHLERIQKVLPELSRLKTLQDRLISMGEVTVLPGDFAENRRRTMRQLSECRLKEARLAEQTGDLQRQISSLVVPEAVLARENEIAELQQRLGTYQQGMKDLPQLKSQRDTAAATAREILADLHQGKETGSELPALNAAERARVQELGQEYQALRLANQSAINDATDLAGELAQNRAKLASLNIPSDPVDLELAVSRAMKRGDLESELRKAQKARDSAEELAQRELKRLRHWKGTLEQLSALAVPPRETVDRFERQFSECHVKISALREQLESNQVSISEIETAIQTLQLSGEIPSEKELNRARERRDTGWRLVRRSLPDQKDQKTGKDNITDETRAFTKDLNQKTLPDAYEKSVQSADDIADRLRKESDRVAKHANFTAQLEKFREAHEIVCNDLSQAQAQLDKLQKKWSGEWSALGFEPDTPQEMRGWLAAQVKLAERADTIREFRIRADEITAIIQQHRIELLDALAAADPKAAKAASADHFDALLERARTSLSRIKENAGDRAQLEKLTEAGAARLERKQREAQDAEQRLARWSCDWTAAIKKLRLPAGALPAEAAAVLSKIADFHSREQQTRGLAERVTLIEDFARDFSRDTMELAKEIAPDLHESSASVLAAKLNQRLMKAREDSVRRSALLNEKSQREKESALLQREIEAISREIKEYCRRAKCADDSRLDAIEERSSEYQKLARQIDELEELLLKMGDGMTLEDLGREAESVNPDSLPAEIHELVTAMTAQEKKVQQIGEETWRLKSVLEAMDGGSKAAEAAENAQLLLGRIRHDTENYLRLRLASAILRSQIERFRKENQGPVLTEASAIFAGLTQGGFTRLEAEVDDEAPLDKQKAGQVILYGVRKDGQRVRADGMSDGTRDQMYLALRLAHLYVYLNTKENEPIPFIADDLLVNFDNERTAATLKVLLDTSKRTQVILFTHHQHMIDLARKTLPHCIIPKDTKRESTLKVFSFPAAAAALEVPKVVADMLNFDAPHE